MRETELCWVAEPANIVRLRRMGMAGVDGQSEGVVAGWYPVTRDGSRQLRWWDGNGWTDHWVPDPTLDGDALDTDQQLDRRSPTAFGNHEPEAGERSFLDDARDVPPASTDPGFGTAAILLAAAILIGLFVPFWGFTGADFGRLSDSSSITATFVPMLLLAGAGGVVAKSVNRSGAMLVCGVGLPFAAFQLMLVRSFFAARSFSEFEAGAGFWVWSAAAVCAVVFVLIALTSRLLAESPEEPLMPQPLGVLGVISGGMYGLGLLIPPDGDVSLWLHLSGGFGWIGVASIAMIVTLPIFGLAMLAHRTQASAALYAGAALFFLSVWFVNTARLGDATQAVRQPVAEGTFALMTVGLLGSTLVACLALFGPWFQRSRPDGTKPTALILVFCLVALAVGAVIALVRHAEEDDFSRFGLSHVPVAELQSTAGEWVSSGNSR